MNIQDILRGLPFPMQGALMSVFGATQGEDPQQPVASTTSAPQAGGGRGFVNPPVVRPSATRPVGVSVPSDDGTTPGILAQINEMQAPSAASLAPDNRDIGGGQSFANAPMQAVMQAPSGNPTEMGPQQGPQSVPALKGYEQGILSKIADGLDKQFGFSQPDFLGRLGTALAVAGSQDPVKAMMEVRQQQIESAKIAEARRKANMPKVDPIAGTPFFQITYPDGRTEVSNNPALAEYYKKQSESKNNAAIEKAVLEDRLARGRDSVKADIKASDAAEPQLKTIQDQMQAIATARETLPRMGTMDQVKGATGRVGSFVAAMADPQMNIDSQRRSAVRVLDWVRSSEPLKGALSNVEGLKLDMPLPEAFASKQEWEAYFDNTEKVLKAAQEYYQKQVNRGSSAVGPNPNAPAASGGLARPANKADYDALPKGSRFIAPDGKEYIK